MGQCTRLRGGLICLGVNCAFGSFGTALGNAEIGCTRETKFFPEVLRAGHVVWGQNGELIRLCSLVMNGLAGLIGVEAATSCVTGVSSKSWMLGRAMLGAVRKSAEFGRSKPGAPLLVLDVFGRSLPVEGQDLKVPLDRNRFRQIANLVVASLVFQLSRDREGLAVGFQ